MTNNLETTFAALADPTRRAVVERLARGPATVSTLHDPDAMALPTFLRHLKVLEDSGVVTSTKKGRVRTCRVNPAPLRALQSWLDQQRGHWAGRMERLSALATDLERTRDDH